MAALSPMQFECSKCGAQLIVDGSTRTPVCGYCKTQSLLPDPVWQALHPPAPPQQGASPSSEASGPNVILFAIVGGIAAAGIAAVVAVSASSKSTPSFIPQPTRHPVAAAGEPCNGLRAACSKDGKAQLSCGTDGKLALSQTCKGPNGCRVLENGDTISCDFSLAELNDPCTHTDASCSTDHKAELRCVAGRYAIVATCKGPDGCQLAHREDGDGLTLSCDDHVADVGDPCVDSGRIACASNKKSLLTCTAQRFVVHKKCRRGCTTQKILGTDQTKMICDN